MTQIDFANNAALILEEDENVIGLAVGGSWLTNELDEFSDVDLVLVSNTIIAGNKELMLHYAGKLGELLSGFTGEHVGEPRVLICLFNDPLLHVDIKFLTLDEFQHRIENPLILLDKGGRLQQIIDHSSATEPGPDLQWIEDRFWTWIHYALLKIGRGEYFEAYDFLGFLRMTVFGPLLHLKHDNAPRGVRKVEQKLTVEDLQLLKGTMGEYNKTALLTALEHSVELYRILRTELFDGAILLNQKAEEKVMLYFKEIKNQG
jgi:hypothetical protein